MDVSSWQARLGELANKYKVPGASMALWHGGELSQAVTGVLNKATGVEVTPDSLFQIGSITKAYTATMIMKLVDDLDTPVVSLLPELKLKDPHVQANVTVRHLLTHTSGLDGDLFLDTGRGDDCVEKYVAACADLDIIHPIGAMMSYCNAAFVILGRIVEVLTSMTWDTALQSLILEPAGLRETWTLPEDVVRFRAAVGHLGPEATPTPVWGITRSMGPAGLINATAADVVRFGLLHLRGGGEVLSADKVVQMQQPHALIPAGSGHDRHMGLCWPLDTWADVNPAGEPHPVYGHAGGTIGQASVLYVLPDDDLVVALLANGGDFEGLVQSAIGDLAARHGIVTPAPPVPPKQPVDVDVAPYTGVYEREGIRLEFTADGTGLRLLYTETALLGAANPPAQVRLAAVGDGVFLGKADDDELWTSFVFSELADGSRYVHTQARAIPKKPSSPSR